MRKKLFLLVGVYLVVACASSAFAAVTLKRLGEHPFTQPAMTSEADLRAMVEKRSADLQTGLSKAGNPELYPEFMAQFQAAKIETIQVTPGEHFAWMLFRNRSTGKVKAIKDVTWAGEAPFDAFRFYIDLDGQRYEFIVAASCGNLALRNIAAIPAPVNQDPVCSMILSNAEIKCGQTITVDATGSTDSDGTISEVVFQLLDASNKVVAEKSDKETPFVQEFTIPCDSPQYTVKAVAIDSKGAQSSPADCTQALKVTQRKGGPVADVGVAIQSDPSTYAFGRVGYEFPLTGNLYAMGLVGGYVVLHEDDNINAEFGAADAFIADALLNYYFTEKLFAGGGVGFWSGNDGKADLIVNIGYMIYEKPNVMKTSIFLEGRCFADELISSEAGRLGVGVRFQF
ncbi:MAG: hypothetical protein Q8R88_14580 [Desulfoprunum sp.]|nr:hypothetical protein [Desulfoprunum sp.]